MNCTYWLRCQANDHFQYHDRMWWHRCEFGNFGVDLSDSCLPHLLCLLAMEMDFAYRVRVLKFLTAHISHLSSQRLCWFWLVFRTDDPHSFQTECGYWCSEIEMYICNSAQHSIHSNNFWFMILFAFYRLLIDLNTSFNSIQFNWIKLIQLGLIIEPCIFWLLTFLVASVAPSSCAGIHHSRIHRFYSNTLNRNYYCSCQMWLANVCVIQNYFCPHENVQWM